MSFDLSATNLTDTSVSLVMTLTSDYESDATISFSFQQGGSSGQTVYSTSATIPSGSQTGDEITTNVDNQLTASTTYYVAATSGGALLDDVTITTKATGYNDPRTATQEQWEDLATKVNNKVEIGSVLSTPSDVAYVASGNIIDGAVTASKIDFSTLSGNYSLSEQNTGFAWIDGSPIYKKTVEIGPMPNNTSVNVAHNITNIGTYVKIESIMVSSAGTSCWSTPYVLVDSVAASETHIIIISNSNLSAYKGYVTLYYTKTS